MHLWDEASEEVGVDGIFGNEAVLGLSRGVLNRAAAHRMATTRQKMVVNVLVSMAKVRRLRFPSTAQSRHEQGKGTSKRSG